ncbi:hypothetical protein QBC32DRAFT_332224 [Pseudoneurospora amorphoporcata]|uniref:Uncharacterized protein n=1 Tax=Pseudoneurospora amorphoporcata TaxID=241081 RepID=A0AAN6P3I1_9PEZI|nr:hypothetical protein QBC32DRAFT_332224 [Pseudoneurospora amorphoporcata]
MRRNRKKRREKGNPGGAIWPPAVWNDHLTDQTNGFSLPPGSRPPASSRKAKSSRGITVPRHLMCHSSEIISLYPTIRRP